VDLLNCLNGIVRSFLRWQRYGSTRRHSNCTSHSLSLSSLAMRSALLLAITALPFLGGALKISTSGRCGTQSKTLTCKGSSFGNCCSGSGWCGSTSAYCDKDCQVGFGDTIPSVDPRGPHSNGLCHWKCESFHRWNLRWR
jgi:hypothetical protein